MAAGSPEDPARKSSSPVPPSHGRKTARNIRALPVVCSYRTRTCAISVPWGHTGEDGGERTEDGGRTEDRGPGGRKEEGETVLHPPQGRSCQISVVPTWATRVARWWRSQPRRASGVWGDGQESWWSRTCVAPRARMASMAASGSVP